MPKPLSSIADGDEFDVVVLGAGGAGMSTALFAAIDAAIDAGPGARVLLVESTAQVGGTTAWSAATTWIPGTHLAPQVNPDDTLERAATFLDAAVGDRSPRAVREALLAHGGEAVAKIEKHSQVKYRIRPFHPDYLSELEGSTLCGRALEPLPFDGRLLGADFDLVRPPMPEFMVLGGMMVDRDDIPHLLGWHKSWKSFRYATRTILRHLRDRLTRERGTRLLMGNALVGRLLLSLRERGVTLLTETHAVALHRGGGNSGNNSRPVTEITLRQGETQRRLRVKGGVVLASGGFNRHPQRRAERLPGIPPEWCPGAPGHTGQAHDLAEAIGAAYGKTGLSDCFWAPVSLRKRRDGSTAAFPHFVFDRAKPHMVTVDSEGERFLNESTSYHLFGLAMQAAHQRRPSIPAYLITDAQGMHKYGLGMVRPRGMGLPEALGDGYVTSASSLAELASKLGLPAEKLQATVARLNAYAVEGTDPEFGRGTTAYQRANGDATWPGRNPSLGPIEKAPFYALRLYPGDIGAATGFATDAQARALDAAGRVIEGLYAVGNDMHSAMGGVYPAPGITIGPGLVFASLAAASAVQRARGAVGTAVHQRLAA
ncbi:MAG: FAD-dependent oxidoreductase [Rubrivivax sp.]|nr:FAD-dependent oxidoreductase [Rubrivivax sp.]